MNGDPNGLTDLETYFDMDNPSDMQPPDSKIADAAHFAQLLNIEELEEIENSEKTPRSSLCIENLSFSLSDPPPTGSRGRRPASLMLPSSHSINFRDVDFHDNEPLASSTYHRRHRSVIGAPQDYQIYEPVESREEGYQTSPATAKYKLEHDFFQEMLLALAFKERKYLEIKQEFQIAGQELDQCRAEINQLLMPNTTNKCFNSPVTPPDDSDTPTITDATFGRELTPTTRDDLTPMFTTPSPRVISPRSFFALGLNAQTLKLVNRETDTELEVKWYVDRNSSETQPNELVRVPKCPKSLGKRSVSFFLKALHFIVLSLPNGPKYVYKDDSMVWLPDRPTPMQILHETNELA